MYYPDNDLLPIFFDTRSETDNVLDHLTEQIGRKGHATVSDLMEIVGLKSSEVHEHFGWTSTSEFDVVAHKNGTYELHVPNFQHLYQLMKNGQE